MSITASYTLPQLWMPAWNPIIYSFVSDKINEPNFSYVVDVYIGAPTIPSIGFPTLRLFQRQSASGNCMVDVSNIVQTYFSMSNWFGTETGAVGGPAYAKYGNTLTPGSSLWNSVVEVLIRVGEQYNVGGVPTIFNGTTNTVGSPTYTLSSNYTGSAARCLPGAIPYPQSVSNITAASVSTCFYNPYIMDGNGLFLTRAGLTQNIMLGQHHSLSFLNQWDDAPGSYAYSVQGIEVIYYNSAGGVISSTFIYNNTGAGGGPQTANNYTAVTYALTTAVLQVAIGPRNLTVPAGAAYYTVQAYRKSSATASTTPGTACSALYRFNLVTPPCSDLYPVVRVAWLNDLGGRDYYNFTMLYEKTTNSESDSWSQTNVNWDGQYAYPLTQNGDWWLRGGPKTFNKVVKTSYVLQTDWLSQAEVDFLGQIPESSQVWAYVGQNVDQPESIKITNVEYTYSTVAQQKLVQVTLECEYSKPQPKQNL